MKKLLVLSTLGLSALALTAGQANAAVLIDNFNTGDIYEEVFPGSCVSGTSTPDPGDTISTTREYNFCVTGTGRIEATLSVDGAVEDDGAPVLAVNNPPNVTSVATLTYSTGGPFNLIPNGEDRIGFNILNNDQGATVKITLGPDSFTQLTTPGQTGPFFIPLSSFPTVNLTSVSQIQLEISGPNDYDFIIDDFETGRVPEPMTILGTGFALAALPGLKKAHKNKKAQ